MNQVECLELENLVMRNMIKRMVKHLAVLESSEDEFRHAIFCGSIEGEIEGIERRIMSALDLGYDLGSVNDGVIRIYSDGREEYVNKIED